MTHVRRVPGFLVLTSAGEYVNFIPSEKSYDTIIYREVAKNAKEIFELFLNLNGF